MNFAPIVLFVFNRPEHTRKTLESLKKNLLAADSELFVFADGPRGESDKAGVDAVKAIIETLDGFKKVTVRRKAKNSGLASSVIAGVSEIIRQYGKVIVVEDDLQFSPHFLDYMNRALALYESDPRVFSVGGYSPPLEIPPSYADDSYLSYRCCTWGWATWRDRWAKVDWDVKDFHKFVNNQSMVERFNRGGDDMTPILKMQMDGKISSWGIRWDYAHFRNEAYCFRPVHSIVGNTGNDGTGIHCGATDKYDVPINSKSTFHFPEPGHLQVDEEVNRRFATFYDGRQRSAAASVTAQVVSKVPLLKRLIGWLRRRTGM